jgi:hypothetical protein
MLDILLNKALMLAVTGPNRGLGSEGDATPARHAAFPLAVQAIKFSADSRFQVRQIVLNRMPNKRIIDSLVLVPVDISGGCRSWPVNFRVSNF